VTARAFLLRGLAVGLLAGFATFLVAYTVGEPHVETAIALEETTGAEDTGHAHVDEPSAGHTHADGPSGGHTHGDDALVSRNHQRTWGLLTGSLGVGLALGGLVALVSAAVAGRLGTLRPGQSTAVVALVGFVAVALVPFLKYPANPPAVGSAETIGARTGDYFVFLLLSLLAAVVATVLATRLSARVGAYAGVLTGVGLYLLVVVAAGLLLPTVNEVGDFPADTLWYFRRASLLTLATMWAVLGVALTGLVGRLGDRENAAAARRELAASL
jgi:hypothetical protein